MKTYFEKMKDIRTDHDLTQQEVADLMHIARESYHRYETGKIEMPIHHLKAFCEIFRISADYLIGIDYKK